MGPGRAESKQQGANWIQPSVTSDNQSSIWRRGQRTKIKTEHRKTKFLYKELSSLLQTLNEQGLHDVLIK